MELVLIVHADIAIPAFQMREKTARIKKRMNFTLPTEYLSYLHQYLFAFRKDYIKSKNFIQIL